MSEYSVAEFSLTSDSLSASLHTMNEKNSQHSAVRDTIADTEERVDALRRAARENQNNMEQIRLETGSRRLREI